MQSRKSILGALTEYQMKRIPQWPYSRDLALRDFYHFGRLENVMYLRNYANELERKDAIEMACVSIAPDALRTAFERWINGCKQVATHGEDYDHIDSTKGSIHSSLGLLPGRICELMKP
jgi:hypothetical protein